MTTEGKSSRARAPMRFLCVHQGYELYGSDRAFVESVGAIRAGWPEARITVLLPRDGPIVAALRPLASDIEFEPLWVLRRSAMRELATIGLLRLPGALWRAARRIRAADLVYVNTVVLADYLIAARLFPGKVLVHVHEIPEGSARRAFRLLLGRARATVVFNSLATRDAFALRQAPTQHVIYNAVAGPPEVAPVGYDGSRPLRILLVGRINRIKGQDLLIEALALLPRATRRRVSARIVGSSFGNDVARETGLRRQVAAAGLEESVRFEPFCDDTGPLYGWADIVVVPSRRPESLGRVAIEAIAHGRPVLASAIGGLTEIVEDRICGWLVPPNDAPRLASALAEIVERPETWRSFPAAARVRYQAVFAGRATPQIQSVVGALLSSREARQPLSGLVQT